MKLGNTIAAAALILSPLSVAAEEITGRYVGISVGMYNFDGGVGSINASGQGGFYIGYDRVIDNNLMLGIELSYNGQSHTLDHPVLHIRDSANFVRLKGKAGMTVNDTGAIYGILGVAHGDFTRTVTDYKPRIQEQFGHSDFGVVYGVGASMAVTDLFRVSVEYLTDNYEGFETDVFQTGVALRF